MTLPAISVIVCTYNRADFLDSCLKSLLQQTFAPENYEICVVNNASVDHTPEVVANLAKQYPRHKLFLVDEPVLGLSRARNRGLVSTTAPLICFGDDDATMVPIWVERFVTRMNSLPPDVIKVGGEIVPVWGGPRPEWLTDNLLPIVSAASGLGKEARLCDIRGRLEGNCCYRRDVLLKFGGFCEFLGRKGPQLLSNDGAIDFLMAAQGLKFFYDPEIIINHYIPADRLTPAWFRRRHFWQGVSDLIARMYLKTHGYDPGGNINFDLPLDVKDWNFINGETTENLQAVCSKLTSLGFVLAMTGIIPIDGK